jgi:hypothetical protein
MLNIKLLAGAVGAEAASRYGFGSGSAKMMWLLVSPAPQHWYKNNHPIIWTFSLYMIKI